MPSTAANAFDAEPPDPCDVCGSPRTVWRKCKLVCLDCSSFVKSCADL